ncbi:MAG: hypothetical protein RLZZ50_560 [Verrucomicrobiota bacterium]
MPRASVARCARPLECGIPATNGRAAQSPILPCTGRGLPCRRPRGRRGELLPHLFTLTPGLPRRRYILCGTVRRRALTRAARAWPRGLARRPALRCPDFPLRPSLCLAPRFRGAVGCERTSERPSAPGSGDQSTKHPRGAQPPIRGLQFAFQYSTRPHWSQVPSLAGSALREPDSASLETFRWQPPHLPPRNGTTTGHWRAATRS